MVLLASLAIGNLRMSLGLVFFVIVAIAAFITLVNVLKSLHRHNAASQELRKRASENIRIEMMSRMIVNQSGALLWTKKGKNFYIDNAMRDYLGLDSNVIDFHGVLDNNDAATQQKIHDFFYIDKPGDYYTQVYGRMYAKEPHWYAFHMHVNETDEGIVSYGVTINIDAIKKQEEQAMETQRMLVTAKERTDFLASMSHQIRTPLNVIMGFVQLLCEQSSNLSSEEVKEYGDEIAYYNSRLMKIIDDVLTTTLISNSNIKMTLEPHHLSEFMDFTQRDTVSSLLKKFNATVNVKEGLEDCVVTVDSLFICRIIDNLIDNAVIASSENCTVFIDWSRNADGTVTLRVTDHGCGIPEEQLEKIFERFYRINKYGDGVGLGLSLSKSLIEKMGGSISVESTVGKGSTFSITMVSEK